MKKMILSMFVLSFLVSSCKKEKEENKAVTPTRENLTGSYKITTITGRQGTGMEADVTDSWLETCERDDVHMLKAELTYEWVDAGMQCEPKGGYTDTWNLLNDKSIIIDGDTYTIKSFDGKNLMLEYAMSSTVSLTATYVKQ